MITLESTLGLIGGQLPKSPRIYFINYIFLQELLCQTKFMCTIVKNVKTECCNNLDIMLPSLTKDDLEYIVEFLYTGQISCPDQETVSHVLTNLSKLL